MIFALFCLQFASIAFGTVTTVYDIETVIRSYLSNTIDQHTLHATSSDYMQMIQRESHVTSRYFQSIRYILHGFVMRNSTDDNDKVHKKLNFIQSIAYYYCGMNMSYIVNTSSLDNICINERQLHMNSTIFPVQMVESYELIRFEICQRIKLELYQSVVDLFKLDKYVQLRQRIKFPKHDSFLLMFIGNVADFISSKTSQSLFAFQGVGQMYPFLVKFGEFELYKETVIRQILQIDNALTLNAEFPGKVMSYDIELCVTQIKYPRMLKYITTTLLEQQVKSTRNKSFILSTSQYHANNFWHHARMYQHLTNSNAINHQTENNTIHLEIRNLMQSLDQCLGATSRSQTIAYCVLIAFRMYQLYHHQDDTDTYEYVLDAIKCIISNHDIYCSKFNTLTNETDHHDFNLTFFTRKRNLRKSLHQGVFYPYINELMNDTQFVNIINDNTDSEIDTYLQTTLSRWMVLALEQYKDIQMIQKIATLFEPKINVCTNCTLDTKYAWYEITRISWMDVLMKHDCMYLTKYFEQRFNHQLDDCSSN